MDDTRCEQKVESKSIMSRYILIILSLVCFAPAMVHAQGQSRKLIRDGNKLYQQKKYKEAAVDYQKALQKDPNNTTGQFNLGNTMYQQKQFDASRKVMTTTAKSTSDKSVKAGANYNIGNTYMEEQKWEEAIEAYKQTLRNNPQDVDAKYNLSYAQEMLKKQQQNGGGKNNKDQNKDNKDQQNKNQQNNKDQNKDNKDKGDQDKDKQNDNKDGDNKDKGHQQQQPQSQAPSKLSQQQADQLLNALQQEEKKLQDKLKKEKGIPAKMDKDW